MVDGVDQDDLAAEWGALLDDDEDEDVAGPEGGGDPGSGNSLDDDMAAQWEAMMDESGDDVNAGITFEQHQPQKNTSKRALTQEEIDGKLGFTGDSLSEFGNEGIMSVINSSSVSYERLPMLEIIFDRLVRLMTSSLRNFTSDNVEVSLDSFTSVRFGDYINSIPLPSILAIFKAKEWDNFGLFNIDSNLIYSIVDILLGGRNTPYSSRVEGRPYTTIETSLVEKMIKVVLIDIEQAFKPITKINFVLERLETNPRFAAIARPVNIAFLVNMRIDMEDRGGKIEFLMPYATIEPIRELLMQGFMGEKFGNDNKWEYHIANEISDTRINIDAILDEMTVSLGQVMDLKVGDTLMFKSNTNKNIELKCGDILLGQGKMGKVKENIAVMVDSGIYEKKLKIGKAKAAMEAENDKPAADSTNN